MSENRDKFSRLWHGYGQHVLAFEGWRGSNSLTGAVTNAHPWETSVFLAQNALLKFATCATSLSIKIDGRHQETPQPW